MKNKLSLLLLVGTGCLMAFAQMNITGKWVGHLVRPHSTDSATFVFNLEQADTKLTGTVIGPDGGSLDIDSGKIMNNNFSFIITENYGQAKIYGTYYPDSLGANVALPNGHKLHMKMLRSR